MNFFESLNNPNLSTAIFWFRRDLRLSDNAGLYFALSENKGVQPIFIFDTNIISELPSNDARISFIYKTLYQLNEHIKTMNKSLLVLKGDPYVVFSTIIKQFPNLKSVYCNEDYEPYAIQRDEKIKKLLEQYSINFKSYKDQVIFSKNDVLKDNGTPFTIYTPYKKKWLQQYYMIGYSMYPSEQYLSNLYSYLYKFPALEDIGFIPSNISVPHIQWEAIDEYDKNRNFPYKNGTTMVSPHLRFGTISIRHLVEIAIKKNATYLSELIWREFFMQILYHYPYVVNNSFRREYDNIRWENNMEYFELWKMGKTGYPLVDAGMRELNATGYMHNRVRMVCASFLTKHLLIDWRYGERYFAEKLLDYELASNNGNWQWSAGTGCDAAPYFRIFNPTLQAEKFDPRNEYIKKWVPELGSKDYPEPIIDHEYARNRAIAVYKKAISSSKI